MVGTARREIVREGEIATYHCWSKCTQRAFLCGYDRETGIDFDYRRGWLESILQYQGGVFAMDVGNYSMLSNHAHWIIRPRPDVVETWPDEEAIWRWKLAWPLFRDGTWMREVREEEVRVLLSQPEEVQRIRRNLSSVSWFMARVKEPMARLCNAEMGVDGHFWAQRFGCRELLDEAAVLACSIYVDLNQMNAGMTDALDASRHSAIYNRIAAAQAREVVASVEAFAATSDERVHQLPRETVEALFADCWLAPIRADGPLITGTGAASPAPAEVIDPTAPPELDADWAAGAVLLTGAGEAGEPGEPESVEAATVDGEPVEAAAVETDGVEAEAVEAGPAESRAQPSADAEQDAAAPRISPAGAEPAGRIPAAPVEEPGTAPVDDTPGMPAGAGEAAERPPLGAGSDACAVEGNAGSGGDAAAESQAAAGDPSVEPGSAAAADSQAAAGAVESTSGGAAAVAARRPRASDNPILGMPFEQYLTVVQQLAAVVLARRSGDGAGGDLASACPEAVTTLEAHGINGEACLVFLDYLESRCHRALGAASRVEGRAREAAQRWFQGLGFCREVFVERPEAGNDDT